MRGPRFAPYDAVRIVALLDPARSYDGAAGIARPPRIGDEAVVVDFNLDPGELDSHARLYILECVADGGAPYWIADFADEELELVWADPGATRPTDAGSG